MISDEETKRPDPAGGNPDRPGPSRRRYERRRPANEPPGPCKRCGGLNGAHYLTCPALQLPGEPEPQP